jgi:hypothetical protein
MPRNDGHHQLSDLVHDSKIETVSTEPAPSMYTTNRVDPCTREISEE